MRRRASQPAFFGAISTVGVFAELQIKLDLIEAFFTHEIFALWAEVAAIDDGINQLVRIALQVATAFDSSDSLEAKSVPDTARCDVGFVDQIENRVRIAKLGSPVNICLAHEPPNTAIPRGIGDEKASVANVTASPGVVGLDVETAQARRGPVLDNVLGSLDVAQEHHGAEVLEPVRGKLVVRHGVDHGIGVTSLDFFVELRTQISQQGRRDLVARREGENRSHGDSVTKSHLAWNNGRGESGLWIAWVRVRRGSRGAVDGGRHLGEA